MKRYLNSILELPDEQIGWLIPALWAGYRLIKREGINVVLSSSPPRTTALVGLLLGELTGVKMITDLRDPWFAPYSSDPELLERWGWSERRSWLGDRIEMWLEREIIERSTKVITTTEHHAQCLRRVYPWIAKDAFYTLRNGYDGEDITAAIDSQALACSQPKQKWTISYLGTFYSSRTPKEFLKALSELIKENSILPGEVEVNLIGHVRHASGELVEELVTSYGIEDYVKIEDPLPYKACLQRIVGADVLLLFQPDQYCSIPSKAFEYLGLKKRILCLAGDGATADLIRETGAGLVVDPGSIDEIKAALARLFADYKRGDNGTYNCDVGIYERGVLAEELSRLLDESLGSEG